MIGNEEELLELEKIEGFNNLEEYMDIITAYEKLKEDLKDCILQIQQDMLKNKTNKALLETCKIMLVKYRKQLETIEKNIEKKKNKFLTSLDNYKNINGDNETIKKLEAIYNKTYYMMYKNEFAYMHEQGNYIVNYDELNKKNTTHKIMLKKIAQLEMKEHEELCK